MRALLLSLALVALPVAAVADDPARGADLFTDHCATCHGVGAQGDGPMRAVLSVEPADLTGLTNRNNGVFPTARVIRRIDGTREVMAHGGPMPVFGLLLDGPSEVIMAPDGSDLVAPESIADIVAWLMEIQA